MIMVMGALNLIWTTQMAAGFLMEVHVSKPGEMLPDGVLCVMYIVTAIGRTHLLGYEILGSMLLTSLPPAMIISLDMLVH